MSPLSRSLTPAPIRSLAIVGGGTAGWMTAVKLACHLSRQPVEITLIESSDIGAVGVGEATVPAIRTYFKEIGVSDHDVMRASQGTVKLGIQFQGWLKPGAQFFHPFSLFGARVRGVPFHHYWLKLCHLGAPTDLGAYSLSTVMAEQGRFREPTQNPEGDLSVYDWAVHFDAGLYARYLRDYGLRLGVKRIDAKIVDIALRPSDGFIQSVQLESGEHVAADLFIDCSGFRALLINALGVGFEDWTKYLPCDRAAAMPCERQAPLTPFTQSIAQKAGWRWRIPLQHRVGNGYVYCSNYISDDEAITTLIANLEGKTLGEPNLIRFTTGHRKKHWEKNCVAIGLAAGFMEPLESTSIVLVQSAIDQLIELFPDLSFNPALEDEFNRRSALEWERIRDFLILHYWANQRPEEPFWRECRTIHLPERLAHKIRMFKERGVIIRYEWETFLDPSWLAMFAGFDLLPRSYDPMADFFTPAQLSEALERMRQTIASAAATGEPHLDYINRYCRA
ncbi:MAG: tryptophan halogenase family protein [Terricaulis silvestris]